MSRTRNLKKFAVVNGKRFYTRDSRTALAIEEQAVVTDSKIAEGLTNIDSTSIKINCVVYNGIVTPGSIVALHDVQEDGTIRVVSAENAEDIIGVWDVTNDTTAVQANDELVVTLEGYVENMRVFYAPDSEYAVSPDPGQCIYVYEGFYNVATGYDTSGVRLGYALSVKWGGSVGALSNQTRMSVIFESPTGNRGLNDGTRDKFAMRAPAKSVGSFAAGTLLVSNGSEDMFGNFLTPELRAFVAGTDDAADIIGCTTYAAGNGTGFGYHMAGLCTIPVASGSVGAAVYAVAGGGTMTTDSTSGVRVGTILTTDPAGVSGVWVVKVQF